MSVPKCLASFSKPINGAKYRVVHARKGGGILADWQKIAFLWIAEQEESERTRWKMTDRCPTDVYYEFHGMGTDKLQLRPCALLGWAYCNGYCNSCRATVTEHTPYDPIEIARQYAPKFDKPAVDMVEVVRCKDCKRYTPYRNMQGEEMGEGECEGYDPCVPANHYCSRGERRC